MSSEPIVTIDGDIKIHETSDEQGQIVILVFARSAGDFETWHPAAALLKTAPDGHWFSCLVREPGLKPHPSRQAALEYILPLVERMHDWTVAKHRLVMAWAKFDYPTAGAA